MPLREIENRPGVVYDPAKKYRIFAEDLQGLDTRITDLEENPGGGVSDWGDIGGTLSDQTDLQDALDDKQDALGFTPEDVANKKTTLADNSDTFYPSQKAVKTAVDSKQDALGFTPVPNTRQVNGHALSSDVTLNQDDVGDGTTYKQYSATDKTKLAGIESGADVTDAGNVGSSIHGASSKTTPVDNDELGLIDSAASNVLKRLTWSNLKATLKTYFDTIYQAALGFTAENVSNKDTDTTLAANSDTKYPSQKATKAYVDNSIPATLAFKTGAATKDTADASTTQTIAHGLGKTPKYVKLSVVWASDTAGSSSARASSTFSFYNGTTQSSVAVHLVGSSNTNGNRSAHSANFRIHASNDVSDYQTGVITFDSTNISIAWTKTGTPSGTANILWEAVG